jgi:hypothetical protein
MPVPSLPVLPCEGNSSRSRNNEFLSSYDGFSGPTSRTGSDDTESTLTEADSKVLEKGKSKRVEGRRRKMVGASGFEPPTSRSRTVRSTMLSHAPTGSN